MPEADKLDGLGGSSLSKRTELALIEHEVASLSAGQSLGLIRERKKERKKLSKFYISNNPLQTLPI